MLKGKQARNGRPLEEVAAQFVRLARPSSIIRRTATVGRSQTLSSTSPRSKGGWRHSGHNHSLRRMLSAFIPGLAGYFGQELYRMNALIK